MSITRSNFRSIIQTLIDNFHASAELLKRTDATISSKLRSQGKTGSQGTGNQITDQEAAFAIHLEKLGFKFIPKPKKNDHLVYITKNNLADGYYYIYQVNGSQRSIDFGLLLVINKKVEDAIYFDLKHTSNTQFYLNDGWFEKDVIYVISWNNGKVDKIFIGLGQNIPTTEECEMMDQIIKLKKQENSKKNKVGSLSITLRFANRYSCGRFDDTFTQQSYESVKEFLLQ